MGLNDQDHEKILYKAIITLGMMCEGCTALQFAAGDNDVINTILCKQYICVAIVPVIIFLAYGLHVIFINSGNGILFSEQVSCEMVLLGFNCKHVTVVSLLVKINYDISCLSIYYQNITMNHPPNRCDFVNAGGVPKVLKTLNSHLTDPDIQMQGMGLFLNILVEDPSAKYNVARTRESALTNGIGVILQDNLDKFSKHEKLCAVCRKLQNALIQVWT